jgi:hypothetical protein
LTVGIRTPVDRSRRVRAARSVVGVLAVSVGAIVLLGGCSNAGGSLARQACVHVDASIHLYTEAEHAKTTAAARHKVNEAADQLGQAEQLAAQANSADPAFNPLMTTLQESGRVPEANLIPALRAQCSAATHPTSQSPVGAGPTTATRPVGGGGNSR